MSSNGRRCPAHDLALDPSGECIVCRRATQPRPRASGAWTALKILFGVLLVALGSASVYRALRWVEPLFDGAPPPAPEPAPIAMGEPPEVIANAPEELVDRARRRSRHARRSEHDEAPAQAAPPTARDEPDRGALLAARRRVRITMYSTSWCGYCRQARAYMNAQGIAYTEHDVDADARAAGRLRAINPRGSVPTFDIDGTTQIGFSSGHLELAIEHAARRHL